jgi:integrase
MARRLKEATLDSRDARRKLKPRGEPYYRSVERGVHLGYRRRANAAGTWLLRHYSDGGYRADRLAVADDLSDADGALVLDYWQAVEAVRRRMAAHGRVLSEGVRQLTVADVMSEYLRFIEAEGHAAHSIRDTLARSNAHILPALGKLKVAELTSDRLRRWRDDLAKAAPRHRAGGGARARRSSANRVWSILRAALNHAFNEGAVTSDLAWRKVKPFRAVDAARVRYLTVAEAKRLINASAPDFRPLVQAALFTGARYGELTRLTIADFNPDVGTIGIKQSKSGKPRHVVLTAEGRAFFHEITAGRAGNETMLRKADGSAWIASHQWRPMLDAVHRAKIAPPIGFHGLRHTWASLSVMNGVPLMVVAKNLGHSDTRMVEKHYGHLAPSYIADAIREGAPRFGFKPRGVVRPIGVRS